MNEKFKAEMSFDKDGLSPFLSAETLQYHYEKHHMGYAKNLNSLIENTKYSQMDLLEIITSSRNNDIKIFNNAAQLYNHDFYWKCLSSTKQNITDKLSKKINQQFGNIDNFLEKYIAFAGTIFGSGWSWIVESTDGKLNFINTSNAETPIGTELNPICVVDLWEHAYYIDYRNDRAQYVEQLIKNHINWSYCEANLKD